MSALSIWSLRRRPGSKSVDSAWTSNLGPGLRRDDELMWLPDATVSSC
jgi:hypothetical protein